MKGKRERERAKGQSDERMQETRETHRERKGRDYYTTTNERTEDDQGE